MITPRFNLSQDDKTLIITIRAPYCNLPELEVDVDENVFLFLCKPYFLRLNLPGSITDINYKSSFDSDASEFTFSYTKLVPGEEFKDLEFITKFLVSHVDATYSEGEEKITILASEGTVDDKTESGDLEKGIGFAQSSHKGFLKVFFEFSDVFDVNPWETNLSARHKLRLQNEQSEFDIGHYISDYIEDQEIMEIIEQNTLWDIFEETSVQFTNSELDFLKDLKNITYNLNEMQVNCVFNGLIDILYAYCYDRRVNFYEDNIESGWTIVKLSASLCWLDAFMSPKETLICSFRRSVIYPLYRHFNLSIKILEDLKSLLKLGEKYIIKCLIHIYNIFLRGDCCRYILNDLFIKDYIVYIMKWDKTKWQEFLEEVYEIDIKRDQLGLKLTEAEEGYVLNALSKLEITKYDSDDIDTDSATSTNTDNETSNSESSSSSDESGSAATEK